MKNINIVPHDIKVWVTSSADIYLLPLQISTGIGRNDFNNSIIIKQNSDSYSCTWFKSTTHSHSSYHSCGYVLLINQL